MVLVQTPTPGQQALDGLKDVEKKDMKLPQGKPKVFMDLAIDGTPLGRIVIELDMEKAPLTCTNFMALCSGSHKDKCDHRLHYKGSIFHRIVPKMYLCGGDVINNNGTSGSSIYGDTFPDEKTGMKHDAPGILSMLGHGPNTNNSQFFVSLTASPWMDDFYVAFGKVITGMDLLQKISEQYGTDTGVPRSSDVRIAECGLLQ